MKAESHVDANFIDKKKKLNEDGFCSNNVFHAKNYRNLKSSNHSTLKNNSVKKMTREKKENITQNQSKKIEITFENKSLNEKKLI